MRFVDSNALLWAICDAAEQDKATRPRVRQPRVARQELSGLSEDAGTTPRRGTRRALIR